MSVGEAPQVGDSGFITPGNESCVQAALVASASFLIPDGRQRWVAYFDLLGVSKQIESGRGIEVLANYSFVLEQVGKRLKDHSRVRAFWFSDTFVFYTCDDSPASFQEIESVARWLAYFVVTTRIPCRGALSVGEMYVDDPHRLYMGPALVEAYRVGEAQDWIGFVLCDSAVAAMVQLNLPIEERLNYVYWEVPVHSAGDSLTRRLAACILGNWSPINGRNQVLESIEQMRRHIIEPKVRRKYDNTVAFLAANDRRWPPSNGNSQGS